MGGWLSVLDAALFEALLLAGCLFLLGGIDDLCGCLTGLAVRRSVRQGEGRQEGDR